MDHLYATLKQKGIVIFKDEEKLKREKSISLELFNGIEESRFAIVILSRNYASSTWCLDELVVISNTIYTYMGSSFNFGLKHSMTFIHLNFSFNQLN